MPRMGIDTRSSRVYGVVLGRENGLMARYIVLREAIMMNDECNLSFVLDTNAWGSCLMPLFNLFAIRCEEFASLEMAALSLTIAAVVIVNGDCKLW